MNKVVAGQKPYRGSQASLQLVLRASGSKLGQQARKKSIPNPLALRSLQDFPGRIRFSWESGNSWEGAAVETPTHPPIHPLSVQGRGDEWGWGGVGAGAVIGAYRRR